MSEEWRAIPGWDALYEASSEGRIRSVPRTIPCGRPPGQTIHHGCVLAPHRNCYGYLRVSLSGPNGKKATPRVHTMVLLAFVGPRPSGMGCRHLNGDKSDNRLTNLAWGTPAENSADLVAHDGQVKGERHHSARLTPDSVREIRASQDPCPKLADKYGVSRHTIRLARVGRTWKHVAPATLADAAEWADWVEAKVDR